MSRNEDYKKSADWLRFRTHWLKDNPPCDNHCYLCSICGHWVSADDITLDHIEPRNADNMFDYNNIAPAHGYCNYEKGSKRWNPKVGKQVYEYLSILDKL